MRRTLLLVAGLVLVAGLANAQVGQIAIFSDASLTSCDITDAGLVSIYVYHINTGAASGSQFRIQQVDGGTLSYLGEQSPFTLVLGNSQIGVAIAYGVCMGATGPIELLTISYFGGGTSAPCSRLIVTDDPTPNPPGIYMTDCATPVPNLLLLTGTQAYINDDGNCPCIAPIPVEETTWGKIKAIYK